MTTETVDSELTIILTAHNRETLVEGALASLAEQRWDGNWDIVLVDFNRDGVADLAAAADNDPDTIWMNSGNGTFADTGQSLGNGHTRSLTTGDVDGDGDIDIVYGDHSAANSVWLNDGSQNFSDSGQSVSVAGDTEAVVLADFTGDGALDIVSTRNGNKSRFYVGGIN